MNWLYRARGAPAARLRAPGRARHATPRCSCRQPEADLFKQLAPESAAKIGFFNNGVDTDYFSPARGYASPYPAGERAVVFTGAMDYWPNIDAVQWFAAEVFPQLRARFADAALLHRRRAARPPRCRRWPSCPAWW